MWRRERFPTHQGEQVFRLGKLFVRVLNVPGEKQVGMRGQRFCDSSRFRPSSVERNARILELAAMHRANRIRAGTSQGASMRQCRFTGTVFLVQSGPRGIQYMCKWQFFHTIYCFGA